MGQKTEPFDKRLRELFGVDARSEGPLAASGAGWRFTGIDLCRPLNPEQVAFLLDALSQFRIVSIAGQDLAAFSLAHFERFANHWGAPVPHPNNFMRGGKPAQQDGDSDGPFELIPFEQRTAAAVNATFPGQLQCLPHESPAVLVVSNFRGERSAAPARVTGGGSWHTDIEYEPLPIYVSMFLAHKPPVAREALGGNWVQAPGDGKAHPYYEGSDRELMRLRKCLPLNGETAFADTAAAFAALPPTEQATLEQVQLRRRLNEGRRRLARSAGAHQPTFWHQVPTQSNLGVAATSAAGDRSGRDVGGSIARVSRPARSACVAAAVPLRPPA